MNETQHGIGNGVCARRAPPQFLEVERYRAVQSYHSDFLWGPVWRKEGHMLWWKLDILGAGTALPFNLERIKTLILTAPWL